MSEDSNISDFQKISEKLFPSAALLSAKAYFDNPAHVYLCPNNKNRLEQLTWLLGVNLRMHLNNGAQSFCYSENGKVQAMGFWTQPNEVTINTITKIRAGLLKVPFKMGWKGFLRVLETSAAIDEQMKKVLGIKERYRCLNYMVMEENRRAKGWGTRILNNQFEIISKVEPNAVLALNTQRYWTVQFYERLGFEVVLEEKIGRGHLAFTNWTMKKILPQ